ncbi:hypothetical protein [Nitriliruptor alkaliphilus]|uniref:hypothetical protein n=1 Tax=Nitriliruptor alkaliphilus TaxID=427918 RepID=UPI0006978016|nr:hypothetical protein [Nitriliruptor alkaliphilus]
MSGGPASGSRCGEPSDDPLRDVVAAVTCWLDDDRARGTAIAAEAVDRDPTGALEGIGALWTVVADVCSELEIDVGAIVRDIALGVALAEVEDDLS